MSPLPLILASSSAYRRSLLEKLPLPFSCHSPNIDESQQPGESAIELVGRLSREKALATAQTLQTGSALIIASDQVASLGEEILTKPGSFEKAQLQLRGCSGQSVTFHTGIALYNTATERMQLGVDDTTVHFRHLTDEQIDRYLERETPYDCAGSFKVEGYGISLFTAIDNQDPNSLIGLPLIKLVEFLGNEGIALP